MSTQTPGRGVSGREIPMEEHPGPALDLGAVCERARRYAALVDRLDTNGRLPGLESGGGTGWAIGLAATLTAADVPALLEELGRLREPAWAQTLFDQRDAALEAVARVRKLHTCSRPDPRYADHCTHCLHPWPCETIQALEGSSA